MEFWLKIGMMICLVPPSEGSSLSMEKVKIDDI